MQLVWFAAASLVGMVLGAVLQYYLTRRAEHERGVLVRRTDAYVDLIKALAALAQIGPDAPGEQVRTFQAFYAEARARVALYGTPGVVTRLGSFLRVPDPRSAEAGTRLVEVVQAMREDGLGTAGSPLQEADLRQLLFPRS